MGDRLGGWMDMLSMCCFPRFPSGFKVVSNTCSGALSILGFGKGFFLTKEEERKNNENARKRNGKGKEEEKKRKDKGKIRGKEIAAERKMSPDANPGFIVQACVAN